MGKDWARAQAHKEGLTSVCFATIEGTTQLLSCGADGNVCVRSAKRPDEVVSTFNIGKPLYSIAASKDGSQFVTTDEEQYVKVYNLPDGDFDNVATRGGLPMRAATYSACGGFIAAGGDEEGVKLVEVGSYKVLRVLKGASYVRSVALDPEGGFVAAVTADGELAVWDAPSGRRLVSAKRAAPRVDPGASLAVNGAAFHPDGGSLLAVPGTSNDVVFYERLSWEASFELGGGEHTAPVNAVSFSPNGLYAVTAGHDKRLVLWDVPARRRLASRDTGDAVVCSVAWHPKDNALAVADEAGGVAVWRGVVPAGRPGPAEAVDDAAMAARENAEDDGMVDASALLQSGEEGAEDGLGSGAPPSGSLPAASSPGGPVSLGTGAGAGAAGANLQQQQQQHGRVRAVAARLPRAQDPIQPGATSEGANGRRFLAYNLDGCITARADGEGLQVVEVAFHDTTRQRRRVPLLNDFFGISLASLGERGALYASPASEHSPSSVLYRPFEAWAPNSDWTAQLPEGEEAVAVAAGRSFCAVATSARMLRVFTPAGLQSHVLALAGPAVALAAHGGALAVVTGGPVRGAGEVALEYRVYDMGTEQLQCSGELPLGSSGTLAWLGFTPSGMLAAQDGGGTVRVRTGAFGGAWMPVFEADAERKGSEVFWAVGVTEAELLCVVCPESAPEPSVLPRPVLTVLPLRVPALEGELRAAELESDVLRASAALHQAHAALARSALPPAALARAEDDARARETDLDRCLLKVFNAALKAGRAARALEAASRLSLRRSLEGALKLANHHRMAPLAERIAALLQERLEAEEEAAAAEAEAALQQQQQEPAAMSPMPAAFASPGPAAAATPAGARAGDDAEEEGADGRPALQLKSPANVPAGTKPAPKPFLKPSTGSGKQSGSAPSSASKRPVAGAAGNPFAKKTKA